MSNLELDSGPRAEGAPAVASPSEAHPAPPNHPHRRLFASATALLGLSLVVMLFSRTVADPDLWGHLRFGLDLLDTGQVVRPDPYSYLTGDQIWYNHEWLAEAAFAGAYRAAAATGLVVLRILMSSATALVVFLALRSCGLAPLRAWTVVAFSAALLALGASTIRPHLFTYLGFALLLYVLLRAEMGERRLLALLPPLFVIWTNAHGGFLAGMAILLLWLGVGIITAIAKYVTGQQPDFKLLAIMGGTVAMCFLATLLNPYGLDLWRFLLATATVARPEITEWRALSIASPTGAVYLVLVALGIASLLLARERVSPFRTLAFVGLALAPLMALRHAPLFAVSVPILLAPELTRAWSRVARNARPRDSRIHYLMTAVSLVAALVLLAAARTRIGCIEFKSDDYPVASVQMLKQGAALGNMAVHFNWGEYVLWHLGPALKVSMDGRRETVYTPTIYEENVNFMMGRGDWDALLRRSAADYALVPVHDPAANLLRLSPGWRLIQEDETAALFISDEAARKRAAIDAWRPAASSAVGCFP